MSNLIENIARHLDDFSDFAVLYPKILAEGDFLKHETPRLLRHRVNDAIADKIRSIDSTNARALARETINFLWNFLRKIADRPGYYAEEVCDIEDEDGCLLHSARLLEEMGCEGYLDSVYTNLRLRKDKIFIPQDLLNFLPRLLAHNTNRILYTIFYDQIYGNVDREFVEERVTEILRGRKKGLSRERLEELVTDEVGIHPEFSAAIREILKNGKF